MALVVDELAVVGARGRLDDVIHAAAAGGRGERRRADGVTQVGLHPARVHGQHDQTGHVAGELPVVSGRRGGGGQVTPPVVTGRRRVTPSVASGRREVIRSACGQREGRSSGRSGTDGRLGGEPSSVESPR